MVGHGGPVNTSPAVETASSSRLSEANRTGEDLLLAETSPSLTQEKSHSCSSTQGDTKDH